MWRPDRVGNDAPSRRCASPRLGPRPPSCKEHRDRRGRACPVPPTPRAHPDRATTSAAPTTLRSKTGCGFCPGRGRPCSATGAPSELAHSRRGPGTKLPSPPRPSSLLRPPHGPDRLRRFELDSIVVVGEEEPCGNPARALVAIDEAVVFREAKRIGGGEVSDIGIGIARQVDVPCQGAFDHNEIADSIGAAVLVDLSLVDGLYNFETDPAPIRRLRIVHFERALSTSRSSCMISSASAI